MGRTRYDTKGGKEGGRRPSPFRRDQEERYNDLFSRAVGRPGSAAMWRHKLSLSEISETIKYKNYR